MERGKRINNEKLPDKTKDRSILSDGIFDFLIKQPFGGDLISLYSFYRRKAIAQRTQQTYCNNTYCKNGLHWGKNKFYRTKKMLEKLGLIEMIKAKRDPVTGIFGKSYIKVNYQWCQIAPPVKNKVFGVPIDTQTPILSPVSSFPVSSFQYSSALRSTKNAYKTKNTPSFRSGVKKEENTSPKKEKNLCPYQWEMGKSFDEGKAGCRNCEENYVKVFFECKRIFIQEKKNEI